MFEKIDLQDAVRRAMQTEKNAMDFYLHGAGLMQNANAKKTFELLAREEREHAEWFFNVYPGDDITDFEAFISTGPDSNSDWMSELKAVKEFTERKAMEMALDKEKKLAEQLRKLAEQIDNPEVKKVFEQNATSTDNHFQLIESEFARLMGMVHETDMDTFVRE